MSTKKWIVNVLGDNFPGRQGRSVQGNIIVDAHELHERTPALQHGPEIFATSASGTKSFVKRSARSRNAIFD